MKKYDYIIIGGGITGITAAEAIRQKDKNGSILVIGDEAHALYSRVLMLKMACGDVDESQMYLRKKEALDDKKIEVRYGEEVNEIRPSNHDIKLKNGELYKYRKLLITTGGRPRQLATKGIDEINAHYFQTLEDARAMRDEESPSALVIGAGFIAMELITSFVCHGRKVVSLLRKERFFSEELDKESGEILSDILKENDVEIRTRVEVVEFKKGDNRIAVSLSSGDILEVDAVGVGIGLKYSIELAKNAGISTDVGVIASPHLETSALDVYVAGDVAEYFDPIIRENRVAGNWQNALFQAKTAATNMTGGDEEYHNITAYATTCFGVPMSFVGVVNMPVDSRIVRKYGDRHVLQLKVRDNKVIGATCIGPFKDRKAVYKLIEEKIELNQQMILAFKDTEIPMKL